MDVSLVKIAYILVPAAQELLYPWFDILLNLSFPLHKPFMNEIADDEEVQEVDEDSDKQDLCIVPIKVLKDVASDEFQDIGKDH